MPVNLAESTPLALAEAAPGTESKGRYRVLLIRAGWGSSGYYSESLLRRFGPKVWPAGTQNYVDHPTETEQREKPERSIKDYASVIVTDPVWDPVEKGLVAEVEVFPQWRDLLNKEFAEKIGLSIRACGVAEYGEAEGRQGQIITELTEGISVDWVTKAGAGGKVLQLIESARNSVPDGRQLTEAAVRLTEGRNIGAHMEAHIHKSFTNKADDMYGDGRLTRPERIGLSEAIGKGLAAFTTHVEAEHPQLYKRDLWTDPTTATMAEARKLREAGPLTANELSTALADAVREVYGGDQIYTWVRDNTDVWVVFTVEDGTDCDLYQQTYTVDANTQEVTLTGQPTEVVARTTYEPAPVNPDEQLTETEPGTKPVNTKESGMPEITEEQVKQLAEAATIRAELTAAQTRLAEADKRDTERAAQDTALTERLTAMDKRLAESEQRADAADKRTARLETERIARAKVTEALRSSELPANAHPRVADDVCRELPFTEAGVLDVAALVESTQKAIDTEAAYIASFTEAAGAGRPRGLGGGGQSAEFDEAAIEAQLEEAFADLGLSAGDAKSAARGR